MRHPHTLGLVLLFSLSWSQSYGSERCAQDAAKILKNGSPSGHWVWQNGDRNVFNFFASDCADRNEFLKQGISTAVHETVHALRGVRNAYPLIDKSYLEVPDTEGLAAPRDIANGFRTKFRIGRDDLMFETYLNNRGKDAASSNTDFSYLLDEFNAYTHDLSVSTDLSEKGIHKMSERPGGMTTMMAYVAHYAEFARTSRPDTWAKLTTNTSVRQTVIRLWTQAESVLARACVQQTKSDDAKDANYIRSICENPSAIAQVIGRPVKCPSHCLTVASTESSTSRPPMGPDSRVRSYRILLDPEVSQGRE